MRFRIIKIQGDPPGRLGHESPLSSLRKGRILTVSGGPVKVTSRKTNCYERRSRVRENLVSLNGN